MAPVYKPLLSLAAAALTLQHGSTAAAADMSPIPLSPDDYALVSTGTPSSPLTVDVYVDLACTDSAQAWSTISKAMDTYAKAARFNLHLLPLPYHRAAFALAETAEVVKATQPGAVLDFVNTAFMNQQQILGDQISSLSDSQVQDIIYGWLQPSGVNMSQQDYAVAMDSDANDEAARYQFKNSILHGVYGTPLVAVGGTLTSMDPSSWTQWQSIMTSVGATKRNLRGARV